MALSREDAVQNERLKLTATALNTLAVSVVTVGVLAQVAPGLFGGPPASSGLAALAVLLWLVFALYLHGLGRLVLGGLRA